MQLPPLLAERYQLVRVIGKGRSFVYEATDQRLGNRRCAIKLLDLSQEPRERIEHEIKILAVHARDLFFIPDIYDTGSDGSQAYIVMEYVEGETLAPTWEAARVEQFVRTMLKYLVRLHGVGIVHRDLKPQNIINTTDPDRPYVLIDFGIAKHGAETITDARTQLSLNYAAPEQFTSTTDARSDLFSLGATAYFLLAGYPPPSALERLHEDTLISPRKHIPEISPALEALLMEMLRLQPNRRPTSAEAALTLLEELSNTTIQVEHSVKQTEILTATDVNSDRHTSEARRATSRSLTYQRLVLLLVGALIPILVGVWVGGAGREGTPQMPTMVSVARGMQGNPTAITTIVADSEVPTHTNIATGSPEPTSIPVVSICKDVGRKDVGRKGATDYEFLRDQGVVVYSHKSTNGAVLNDKVRIVKIHQNGLLIGYHATDSNPANGLSYLSHTTMLDCNSPEATAGMNVNAIAVDQSLRVWVGGERGGLVMFDNMQTRRYSTKDVLPSDEIFGLTADGNNVWISTLRGVAKIENGDIWSIPYQSSQNLSIASDDIHIVAVDKYEWIWVGHINNGISLLRKGQPWKRYPTNNHEFKGLKIRDILALEKDNQQQIWIATADSGVILYQNDTWTTFDTVSGLPSNEVRDIAIDKYQRLWFATTKGVVFFDGQHWIIYNTLPTNSIDFGSAANPSCIGCRFDNDSVWTGTDGYGLTYSRLPLPDVAFDVVRICFWLPEQPQICPHLTQAALVVTATYTATLLQPNDTLSFFIEMTPRGGYDLAEARGDQLLNVDPGNRVLFGVHDNIGVKGAIAPGSSHRFFHADKPLVATTLDACQREEKELICTSSWRLWMRTRHAGPAIKLVFRVKVPTSMSTSIPHG